MFHLLQHNLEIMIGVKAEKDENKFGNLGFYTYLYSIKLTNENRKSAAKP